MKSVLFMVVAAFLLSSSPEASAAAPEVRLACKDDNGNRAWARFSGELLVRKHASLPKKAALQFKINDGSATAWRTSMYMVLPIGQVKYVEFRNKTLSRVISFQFPKDGSAIAGNFTPTGDTTYSMTCIRR